MIEGAISPVGDVDFFKFTVPAAGATVRLETFDATGKDCAVGMTTTLKLYGPSLVQFTPATVGIGDGIGGCSALVYFFSGGAGDYYVSVEETGNDAVIGTYRLEVKVQKGGSLESEINDLPASADPIPTTAPPDSDVSILSNHIMGDVSVDYYKITVPEGKSIRAEVIEGDAESCTTVGDIDSRLTLYKGDGTTQIAQDNDGGRGTCSKIDGTGGLLQKTPAAHGLPADTYYLKVDSIASGGAAQFKYRVAVTVR